MRGIPGDFHVLVGGIPVEQVGIAELRPAVGGGIDGEILHPGIGPNLGTGGGNKAEGSTENKTEF